MVEATYMPVYLDHSKWLKQIYVKIDMVDQNVTLDASGSPSIIKNVVQQTYILNENLRK